VLLTLKQIPRAAPIYSKIASERDSFKHQWDNSLFMGDLFEVWLLLWRGHSIFL